jgi:hypothetical protein
MLATDSSAVVLAHSANSSAMGVATLGHLASTSGIVAGAFGTEGSAAALVSVVCSFVAVRRIG